MGLDGSKELIERLSTFPKEFQEAIDWNRVLEKYQNFIKDGKNLIKVLIRKINTGVLEEIVHSYGISHTRII